MKKIIFYLPRALSLLLVGFLALFILEGFDSEYGWQSGIGHAALAALVGLFVWLAWKRPRAGGWVFVAMGLWYCWSTIIRARWYGGLFLGSVPIVIGVLFLVEGFKKK